MTPNNETINKLIQNEDKNEEIISGLKKLVLEDKKCISYTYVSLRFGVHVKQSIQILDKFVAQQRNGDNPLAINYLLYGNNDTTDNDTEVKMERFMIVNETEVESASEWFKNGFNKHIYSIGLGEDNDKIDLNFDEYDYELKDKKDLNELHNLRYVKNPNIEFRNVRRRVAIKPIVHKVEEKDEKRDKNSNTNKETETKVKPKTYTKTKNTKNKNKISNMFSKNKKEVKVENEEKESDDPFGSDSEDDTKPKLESNPASDAEKSVDEVEEEIIEKVTKVENRKTVKNGNKRQSKNDSENSEDEEIISTKKRGKKYKRVRLISESDSDDSKEESALDKYVSTKRDKKCEPIKRVEEVKETHVDEDGYVVTKTVKKEVEDNKESDISDKSEDTSEKSEKTKPNAKKNDVKKVEKKAPKASKDTKSKGQSSITSFFKPKIST